MIRWLPRATAILAVIVGVLALAAQLADVGPFAVVIGRAPPMRMTSAIASVLAGLALWASVREPFAPRSRSFAAICASATCAIAAVRIVGSAAGVDIDGGASQAALGFLFVGSALVTFDRSIRGYRHADYLAIAAILVAAVALLGHLFAVPVMYGLHVGMSASTAVVVLGLGVGILAARLERGPLAVIVANDTGGIAARQLLGGLLVLPPLAVAIFAGAHAGWYTVAFAGALVLLVSLTEVGALILTTARRLAALESARRASDARVRALVDQASDAIFVADLAGRYIEVNDAACRLLGRSRAELLGMTIADLIPSEDVARLAASKDALLAGGVHVAEWVLRRADTSYVPVEVSAKILPDGRWQAIVRDITERKRTEAALARAAATEHALRGELEGLIGALSHTVSELPHTDVEAVLRVVAEQARALTGASYAITAVTAASNATAKRWATAGLPLEAVAATGRPPRVAGVFERLVATPVPIRADDIALDPAFRGFVGGLPPIASFLGVPILHAGKLVGTLCLANRRGEPAFTDHDERVITNLADRVAAAIEMATLYAAEAHGRAWLQSIIDQLPEGVRVIDAGGQVSATNRALRTLARPHATGPDVARDDAIDLFGTDRRPVPADDRPAAHVLRTGEVIRDREYLLRQDDGRMVPIVATAGPVRDGDGQIAGAVVVVTDVSERKEVERMREEWIAVVAHDLRQPLNTILLWCDRLLALATEDTQRAAVQRVRGAGWRLNRMVEDLLDAARITANRLSIDPRAGDVVELAEHAVESARLANPNVHIELVAPTRELAWFDADRILQVLNNLISNAIKYGEPGAPIRIEVASRDPVVEIAILNRGATIADDELPRLFSRFSRTQHARDARIPGIGLGLYICKGLIEAHGGEIWAESSGGMTAFRLTLRRPPE